MISNLSIEVESSMPLQSYGDGHVIVYNSSSGKYYVTTRESFLMQQNAKIEELEKELKQFESKMENKMNDFLSKYKETNAKMIAYIKSATTTGEN